MDIIRYQKTDRIMKKGDYIKIHRVLLKDLNGQVIHVYDPDLPILPRGENEYGFTVKLENGKHRWYSGQADDSIIFVKECSCL